MSSFGPLSGIPGSRGGSFNTLGDLDSSRFGSEGSLGDLKLGGSGDPFKVSTALDDSLDFDAVMRLPLNFDDPVDSNTDSSFGPFRSTRKFDDDSSLGIGGLPKLNSSSSGFYSGSNGYSDMPPGYGSGLSPSIPEFSRLGSIGSHSYLPPNPAQEHYADPGPGLGGGYHVGFSSDGYNTSSKPAFDSMSYGVGIDSALGSCLLSGHEMPQGNYRPPLGYTGTHGQQYAMERRLDADILPDSAFPNIAWLRKYGMGMYRWTPDASEIAMHIRQDLVVPLIGHDSGLLSDLIRRSNCMVKLEYQLLQGSRESFLVFQSGVERAMTAIQMVAERLRLILGGAPQARPPMNGSLPPSASRLNTAK